MKKGYKKKAPAKGRRAPSKKGRGVPKLRGTLAPTHMITQLKFVNVYQKQTPTGVGVSSYNQFRMNSIWDPDLTNALGTSCLGITQWSGIYQRYRVFKFDYKITITNLTEDLMISGAIVPQNYTDSVYSISDMMRPSARRWECGNKSGQNRAVLTGTYYIPKITGQTSTQYKTDNNNVAGFSANPSQAAVLTILAQTSSGAQAYIGVQVDFTYHVEMISIQASSEAIDLNTGTAVVPVERYCT